MFMQQSLCRTKIRCDFKIFWLWVYIYHNFGCGVSIEQCGGDKNCAHFYKICKMVQKLKLSQNVNTKIRVRIKYSEKKIIFKKIKTIVHIERIMLKIKNFVTSASISINFKISSKPGHFNAKNNSNFVYPILIDTPKPKSCIYISRMTLETFLKSDISFSCLPLPLHGASFRLETTV